MFSLPRVAALLSLAACVSPKYASLPASETGTLAAAAPVDEGAASEDTADLSALVFYDCIEAGFSHWGTELERCRVEVGFVRADDPSHAHDDHDEDEDEDEDEPEPEPERHGECTLERRSEGSGPGEEPGPEGPSTGIDAGPTLVLRSADREVVLQRFTAPAGGVLYHLPDCDLDRFPFGEVMDLVVEGSELSGMPDFVVEEAVWFPGRSPLTAPVLAPDTPAHSAESSTALTVAWTVEDPLETRMGVSIQVESEPSTGPREELRCPITPESEAVAFPASGLAALTGHDEDPAARVRLTHRRAVDSPARTLPWGREMAPRALWSLWGELHLDGAPAAE